jgi:hypothetical protein
MALHKDRIHSGDMSRLQAWLSSLSGLVQTPSSPLCKRSLKQAVPPNTGTLTLRQPKEARTLREHLRLRVPSSGTGTELPLDGEDLLGLRGERDPNGLGGHTSLLET